MVLFQSEDRLRQKRQKVERAINFAMQNRWSEAIDLNRELIEEFPADVDGHNRLGKALMELGRYGEARDAYGAALRVDSMNGIAQKNFARLSKLVEEQAAAAEPVPTPVDPSLFIEETGKTALTTLTSIAEPDALARITAGDPLTLEVHGNVVRVTGPAGEPLGRLEPKIGQRVIGLMNEGNQYTAAVTAVDDQSVRVIIREAYRDPSMGDRPSFPTTGATDSFRAYTRETVIRYDVEDEDEDGMDEIDSEHQTTSEADSDGEAGAEESEFSEES